MEASTATRPPAEPASGSPAGTRGANLLLAGLALAWFLIEWIPGITGPYGWFIDELYYLACAKHLAWGYVDHPPLSIALLALVRAVGGDSLAVLRLVPALAGAATVVTTGLLARRLGAGTFGQALAAGCVMAGAIAMVMFGFYSMNALDMLLWVVCSWILVDAAEYDRPRDWILFGVAFGIGLMNKHTIVLLAVGLVAGMLLTRARRQLVRPWFWIAMGVALLLLSPNLIWQIRNGWPSIAFYVSADILKNNPTPPLEVVLQQVMFMNPATLPVWLGGLVFLFGWRGGKLRHLAWIYIVLLLMLALGQKSRPDRLAPAYALLFAAGGAGIDAFIRRRGARWLRPVLVGGLIAFAAVLAPLGIPFLPPATTAHYGAALGIVPQIESGAGKRSQLPQWLADRFGWKRLADDVAGVAATLEPGERAAAIVLARSYGEAGAIERFGSGRVPPVYGLQNTYHLWGPPPEPVETVITVGFPEDVMRRWFDRVTLARVYECEWCMPWRDHAAIWIGRGPKVPLRDVWPRIGHYE